jgi:threonine dehydrogenase-like Zn-dependent dehydrogenase
MNSVLANAAEKVLGDRETSATKEHQTRAGGETMRALVWHSKRDVRVEDVPVPTITDPKDVVCRVTGTTICGSDLHLYHREILQLQAGEILGHEWIGIVDEVGPEVQKLKKGDRVVASFQIA